MTDIIANPKCCDWCGKQVNKARRFCSTKHHDEFHKAARLYGARAFDRGEVSRDELRALLEPYTAFQRAKAA